ncbi:radical SAM protein [Ruminococcus sp. Marseille-P6503]|uniref:radical SAM protein n=1 Tax=Ruminococcus sp. Marseille-P6503 TaxID=2364796 RepID=UPI000F529B80|nr:radical SAM protein [Ruminococcus sp. Marseille-P6503]
MKGSLENCRLCPRECGINRYERTGYCGEGANIRIARADLHFWEEPCISGKNGSGTVFFSGCALKCRFCQNYEISAENKGFEISVKQLATIFLMLQSKGAENINLVNPTHFVPQIISALELCRNRLNIPVVYNCGGYEKTETLELMRGYADIFLPDLKYYSNKLSSEYSKADDYFEKSLKAVIKMREIAGKPQFDKHGMLKKGVMIRHLVLPNHRRDSIEIMKILGRVFEKDDILISLMSQYTPVYKAFQHKEISRRTTTFEYESVVREAEKYEFEGYIQQKSSADTAFIPEFFDYLYFDLLNFTADTDL